MLQQSLERILAGLGPDDVVLDVGGWGKPFARADWVIDLMPYTGRGLYASADYDPATERFSARTWVQRDICERQRWPFEDDFFDFAVCSHTLEDVRDPVWVCSELTRVAKAGYVEVPSRLEEQSLGVHGPWAGWSHHHWLVDRTDECVRFVFKSAVIGHDPRFHFPAPFGAALSAEERVEAIFWQGRLEAAEAVFTDSEAHDEYLASFVAANRDLTANRGRDGAAPGPAPLSSLRRAAAALRRRV